MKINWWPHYRNTGFALKFISMTRFLTALTACVPNE